MSRRVRMRSHGPAKTFATTPRSEPRTHAPCASCGSSGSAPLWDCGGFVFVRCLRCGLVRQDPRPEPEAIAARYDGEYLAYEIERQSAYRDLELLALADLNIDLCAAPLFAARAARGVRPRVLDVGCATGALLDALRERGWEPTGVEISPQMSTYGVERYGLPIRAGSLESAAFASASFDLVHASHLIEHLNDPASFLDEAARVLSPDGFLVLTTPNIDGFQARLLGRAWRSAICDHLYLFSIRTLTGLLDRHGFEPLRTVTWGGWAAGLEPAFIKRPLDRWAKRTGRGDVVALLARKSERSGGA
jgi:SAM-dependent methyltransferase